MLWRPPKNEKEREKEGKRKEEKEEREEKKEKWKEKKEEKTKRKGRKEMEEREREDSLKMGCLAGTAAAVPGVWPVAVSAARLRDLARVEEVRARA